MKVSTKVDSSVIERFYRGVLAAETWSQDTREGERKLRARNLKTLKVVIVDYWYIHRRAASRRYERQTNDQSRMSRKGKATLVGGPKNTMVSPERISFTMPVYVDICRGQRGVSRH